MALSDESLLAGLASGDPDAATAFVRRFQRRVFGLAVTIVGDRQAAEDVAQETFLRVWRNASAYDARRGAVATWLLTIARNVAVDTLRVRRSHPVDPDEILLLAAGSTDDHGDDRLVMADETHRLKRAIGALPMEQRRAVVLAAFYGRTAVEIGDQERIPVGTAKTRIRTGMIKLRAALKVNDDQ